MDKAQTILLYGATDTGKTTQLGRIARYLWENRGWRGRLVSADSGWAPIADLIRSPENPDGPVDAFDLASTPKVLETLAGISQGYWPSLTQGPDGSPIYRLLKTKPEGWQHIRFYLLEGWSAFANLLMAQLVRERRKIAEDVVNPYELAIPIWDPENSKSQEVFKVMAGAPGRAHYKHVQDLLTVTLLPPFKSLPVEYVIWSGHEAKGEDELNKNLVVLGPASVGKAIVGRTTECFGHAFHMDKEITPGKDGISIEHRAYFSSHPEPAVAKALWPAKVSLSLELNDKLRSIYPKGFIPLAKDSSRAWHGMEDFVKFLEANKVVGYANQAQPANLVESKSK